MYSIPNRFNAYVEEETTTTNHHRGFVEMNNNSSVIRSMFLPPTSDQTNLFSSSPSFSSYQNSQVTSSLSSSFGFNIGSQMTMRRNFDSDIVSVSNLTPLRDNPHLTQISFTETTTKRYSALVPTNTISSYQNDFQLENLDSRTNLWNPRLIQSQTLFDTNSDEILNTNPLSVVNQHQESAYVFSPPPSRNPYQYGSSVMKSPEPQIQPPTFPDTNTGEISSPEPLNVDYPHQKSAYPHHSDMFTSAPSRNPYQYGSPMKTPEPVQIQPPTVPDGTNTDEILSPEPLRVVYPNQESAYPYHSDMFSSSPNPNQDPADGPEQTRFSEVTAEKDGRTHSLPCKKFGPYKCPKCDGVFDTSQIFAAHMSSHYKNETKKEREERLRARSKKKFRKLSQGIRYKPQKKKIKVENIGESSGAANAMMSTVPGAFINYPVAVKKEQV